MRTPPQIPFRVSRRGQSRGFTLIELMIVMVIISILAAITIPGAKAIIDRAYRSMAANTAYGLESAIASYYTEYRRFPVRNPGVEDAAAPILTGHSLMDILLASDAEVGPGGMNPRRLVTFSAKKARPMGGGRYRGGLRHDASGGGTLWDPWGNHYRVVMDLNHDSRVPSPPFAKDSPFLAQGVIVWSAGKDGDDSAATDNVVTW